MQIQEQRDKQHSAFPFRFALAILIVSLILIALCIIFIFLIIKILGLNNTGLIFASILYSIFTTVFNIGIFILGYFQLLSGNKLGLYRQNAIFPASRNPLGILGVPPPVNPITTQQRETNVKDVYAKLSQPHAKAVVLTGIVGSGKSTLASLVCEYTKKQIKTNQGLFTDEPIWIEVNQDTLLADLAVTLFKELGKPMADLENLSPLNQAVKIFRALDEINGTRLIVLDQFDRLLDKQTGYVEKEHLGLGEWLDVILSQPSKCRFLLTSCLWPRGPHSYNPTDENRYHAQGLNESEAKQLLVQIDSKVIQAKTDELDKIFVYCDHHPLSLALLAFRLKDQNLDISTFLNDPVHIQTWIEKVASSGLDGGLNALYRMQLTPLQRQLLLSFSVFRKPIPRSAAQAVMNSTLSGSRAQQVMRTILNFPITPERLLSNCDVLVRLYLLQKSVDYQDYYWLDSTVSTYLQYQFDRSDDESNKEIQQEAHAEAATYYLQQLKKLTGQNKLHFDNIQEQTCSVEAIWHQCQSGQYDKAYKLLLERENINLNLRNKQENLILLDLYQQLLLTNEWHSKPVEKSNIYTHLGEICHSLGKRQEAELYYRVVLDLSKSIGDYNKVREIEEMIAELNQNI